MLYAISRSSPGLPRMCKTSKRALPHLFFWHVWGRPGDEADLLHLVALN